MYFILRLYVLCYRDCVLFVVDSVAIMFTVRSCLLVVRLACLSQCLDEVQSYILVERSIEKHNVALDSVVHEFRHVVSCYFSFHLSSFVILGLFGEIKKFRANFIFRFRGL